jgi:hypothetical protein
MQRLERAAPLPAEMQGRWVELDDPSAELIVNGGEIACYGQIVDYDFKEISEEHGALSVSLKIDDAAKEDEFQQANITGLVITPEGEFLVFNVSFGSRFVRPAS